MITPAIDTGHHDWSLRRQSTAVRTQPAARCGWAQEPSLIKPFHPLRLCELDDLEIPPQATTDDFGLVQPGHRIGEGVVKRIARAPDRRLNPGLGAPLRVAEWDMLADVPVVVFYQELDEAYPGSKFILTTRGMDAWLKSCANHFDRLALQPDGILTAILLDVYGCIWYDADRFARAYREHVADVTEYFRDRPNDLLVLDVNAPDKWPAICEFVGVDVPDRPYPKSNVSLKLPRPLKKLARLVRNRLYWPFKRALGLTYPARLLGRGRPR